MTYTVMIVCVVMSVVRVVVAVTLVVVTVGEGSDEGCAQVLRFVSFPFVGVVGVGRSRVARVVVIVALVVVTVGEVSDA